MPDPAHVALITLISNKLSALSEVDPLSLHVVNDLVDNRLSRSGRSSIIGLSSREEQWTRRPGTSQSQEVAAAISLTENQRHMVMRMGLSFSEFATPKASSTVR